MRLPLVTDISSRDGSSTKNGRMYNVLGEKRPNGDRFAAVRPGLTESDVLSGNGRGLVCWNGTLVGVYGTTAYSTLNGQEIYSTMPGFAAPTSVATNGAGTFVATGDFQPYSYVDVSTDGGETWSQISMPSSATWVSVCWNGTVFVCFGNGSDKAATSTDGLVWTARTMPSSANWVRCIWNGSVFCVTTTGSNKCATSADGISWTAGTMPSTSNWSLLSWNGAVFCSVAPSTTKAATSSDGLTWTARTISPSVNWRALGWNGTSFVVIQYAGTTTKTSPDGITWSSGAAMPFTSNWSDVAFDSSNKAMAAPGFGEVAASSVNLSSWASDITLPIEAHWIVVIYSGGRFYFAGYVSGTNYFYSPVTPIAIGTVSGTFFDFAQSPT